MKEYIRWHKKTIEEALKTRRIVIVSGARQVGKTTLTKQILNKDFIFRTLDDTSLLKVASEDPSGFLKHTARTMVIDEIQKEPKLLPEIKKIVDVTNKKGQFILTGSADIQSLPTVKESLAGRVKNIHLRPLTQGEILGTKPNFLKNAFNSKFKTQYKNFSKQDILKIALRGGYPEVIPLSAKHRRDWHKDYLEALINKDLQDIFNIQRNDVLYDLIKVIAAWSSKYMDIKDICSKIELSKQTLKTYVSFFEKIYLCEKLSAWSKSDYDRITKKDKFFMSDTGLMASVLNWHYEDVNLDSDKYGKIIETFVFNELSAQIDLNRDYSLYQYRDREKREIDFIVEDEKGDIVAIEVKGGSNIGKEDFKHIKWFKANLAKNRKVKGIVLYSGENTLPFGQDMLAVPTASLWQE